MGAEKKKICACPLCHSRYRVPEALKGKTVSCKKCGSSFKVFFEVAGDQEESPQETAVVQEVSEKPTHEREEAPKGIEEQEVSDKAFDLTVSEDKLEAYICPRGKVPLEISLGDIKELLAMRGIQYGIVDDTVITEYLKNRPIRKKPWKIAEGKAPGPARNDEVKYYFDTDSLKIGTLKDGGIVDFKDRGEIPHAKKGDLIAEKIPGVDGTGGMDVFGLIFPAPKAKNIKLRCGKGAEKSEDGLKVFAKLDGRPEISAHGKLFVLPELKISGDVGLDTGHIEFDGNIDVHGSVQDGFRVRGGKLSAKEILKAEIDIAGDIVVLGGIIGARIKTGGSVRAKHVNASDIEALGDVVVENELLNSRIESSGACLVKGGTILSSSISARKGIEANEIGSDTSKPCTLAVAFDERVINEVDKIKEQITLKKEEQEKRRTRVDELQEEAKRIEKETGELAQVQDRAMVEQRTFKEEREELKKGNNTEQLAQVEMLIKDLDSKIDQTEKNLEQLLNKQDQITEKITGFQDEIKNSEEEIKGFRDEIEALSEWSQRDKGLPTVKVGGVIFSETTIRGPHSSAVLRKNLRQVSIKETKISDPDSGVKWKMNVSRLD